MGVADDWAAAVVDVDDAEMLVDDDDDDAVVDGDDDDAVVDGNDADNAAATVPTASAPRVPALAP